MNRTVAGFKCWLGFHEMYIVDDRDGGFWEVCCKWCGKHLGLDAKP